MTAKTLEPVARLGDILLDVEPGGPSNRSLVIALSDSLILARRYELAKNQTDIAVMIAPSINPLRVLICRANS